MNPAQTDSPPPPMRWRRMFFTEPDRGNAAAFAQEIAWDNLRRARVLAWFIIGLTGFMLLVPDVVFLRSGRWAENPAFLRWALCHAAMLVTAVAAAAFAYWRSNERPEQVNRWDILGLNGFVYLFLALLVVSTWVQQQTSGQISTLLLGIGVYGACFYSRPRTSLLVIGGATVALCSGLPFVQSNPATLVNHFVTSFVFGTVFWFVSRLVYSLRAADFNALQTIARQTRSLEEANTRLREANELKSELVGIAAHDLRDPLNAIGGLAQELQAELASSSHARELAKGISESTRRMSHLIENLITEAENEVRGLSLVREPYDLIALVDDVVADYRWLATSKNLTLVTEMPDAGRLFIEMDHNRVRQVLENLLSNAIKYSTAHKVVRLRVIARTPNGARLEVQDEGAGLSAEDRPRLFQKFQRLSARPTNREGTSGLGLAIVKAIVDAHGGRVWAESPGLHRGSTFIVELP